MKYQYNFIRISVAASFGSWLQLFPMHYKESSWISLMKSCPFSLQFPLNTWFENHLDATCYRHFSICGKPILGLNTHKQWHNLVNRSSSIIVHKSKELWTWKKLKLLLKSWSVPSNAFRFLFHSDLCPANVSSFLLGKSLSWAVNIVIFSVDT